MKQNSNTISTLVATGTQKRSGGITKITVGGFKSISEKQSLELRPLTLLAGANSSGKSAFLQPVLLLKQTLEVSYDPGPLLLDGPNVRFASGSEFLSRVSGEASVDNFMVGLQIGTSTEAETVFEHEPQKGFAIKRENVRFHGETVTLVPGAKFGAITTLMPSGNWVSLKADPGSYFVVVRDRCALSWAINREGEHAGVPPILGFSTPYGFFAQYITGLIHLPGLRGNPARLYPVTSIGSVFPGTFERYVASLIMGWQSAGNTDILAALNRDIAFLGMTSSVTARAVTEASVELRVGRTVQNGGDSSPSSVSIADAGLGVSQVLPLLVALLAANSAQAVYVEQPEIHLHPRAQVQLAHILANAASRGVKVVAETHSSLLIRGIQTLVAKGELDPSKAALVQPKRERRGDHRDQCRSG